MTELLSEQLRQMERNIESSALGDCACDQGLIQRAVVAVEALEDILDRVDSSLEDGYETIRLQYVKRMCEKGLQK